jgi:hypothetical protein
MRQCPLWLQRFALTINLFDLGGGTSLCNCLELSPVGRCNFRLTVQAHDSHGGNRRSAKQLPKRTCHGVVTNVVFKSAHVTFVSGATINRIIPLDVTLDRWLAGFGDKNRQRCSWFRRTRRLGSLFFRSSTRV